MNKKIIVGLLSVFCLPCLMGWTQPSVSRQPALSSAYEKNLAKAKERAREEKQERLEQKGALRKQSRLASSAREKNKLAYFADQDGFIWFDDESNSYT